jgi:predicted cupin superfamily sugar epimerase
VSDTAAATLISHLGLQPHPEGGWYRETWRGATDADGRASETAIYFLLDTGQSSHWHRVDATEIWLWHAGSPITLRTAPDDATKATRITLGSDLLNSQQLQYVIAPGHWQAATADRGWALVSCVVSPGFDFAGFTLAPPGWEPGGAGQG